MANNKVISSGKNTKWNNPAKKWLTNKEQRQQKTGINRGNKKRVRTEHTQIGGELTDRTKHRSVRPGIGRIPAKRGCGQGREPEEQPQIAVITGQTAGKGQNRVKIARDQGHRKITQEQIGDGRSESEATAGKSTARLARKRPDLDKISPANGRETQRQARVKRVKKPNQKPKNQQISKQ